MTLCGIGDGVGEGVGGGVGVGVGLGVGDVVVGDGVGDGDGDCVGFGVGDWFENNDGEDDGWVLGVADVVSPPPLHVEGHLNTVMGSLQSMFTIN